jgi:hypothetical protein
MSVSEILNLYAVVWSEKQQAFHIESVDDMLRRNLHSYYHTHEGAADSDWICVALAQTHPEARSCIARLRAGMDLQTPPP